MRIVLAYTGSLEGSGAIQWLRDRYAAEVVTVTLDLGLGRVLEAVRDRALALGAQRAHVIDARDVFAHEFVVPALRSDAMHEGHVPMAQALSRPLIARTLVEIAGIEQADAVAHTGGAGTDLSRLDRLLTSLAPALPVLTPAREWGADPQALAAFGVQHRLAADAGAWDARAADANFWGGSPGIPVRFAGPAPAPTASVEPAAIAITFAHGVPTALNGVSLPFVDLATSLGTLAARHGVGGVRADGRACDAPAALLLHAAHRDLTAAVSAPDVRSLSAAATAAYVSLVEEARWFSPLRDGLDAFFAAVQMPVTGHVHMRLAGGEFVTTATELSSSPQETRLHPVLSHTQH